MNKTFTSELGHVPVCSKVFKAVSHLINAKQETVLVGYHTETAGQLFTIQTPGTEKFRGFHAGFRHYSIAYASTLLPTLLPSGLTYSVTGRTIGVVGQEIGGVAASFYR